MAENELPIIKLPAKDIVSSGGSFESDFKFTDDDLNKLLEQYKSGEVDIPKELQDEEGQLKKITPNIEFDIVLQGRERALDNKMNYISSLVGEPVINEGTDISDFGLKFDLSRSNFFETRKVKFLDKYPEGSYTRVQVPITEDETDYVEIYKKNKNKEGWKMINPYGRDVGEIGSVSGYIIDEQTAAEIGSLFLPWKKSSLLARGAKVFLGSVFGIKARETSEFLRGYGEEEFKEEKIGDIDWLKSFQDANDWFSATIGATFQMGSDFIMGNLTGRIRPTLIEDAPSVIKAAEDLGLEPFVYAQLVANPLIKRTYFQAGEFTKIPREKLEKQLLSLNKKLQELAGKQNLNKGDLLDIINRLEANMADDMVFFKNTKVGMDDANKSLADSIVKYNEYNQDLTKSLTNEAISYSTDASVNMLPLKNIAGRVRTSFISKPFAGKDEVIKVYDEFGKVIETKIKPKKYKVGEVPQEVQSLLNDIGKFKNSANAVETKGNKLNALDALVKMREKAYKLTLSPDPKINASGQKLYNKIVNMFDINAGYFNGNAEFGVTLKMIDNVVSNSEKTNSLVFVKQALSKNFDPDSFAETFLQPNNNIKINALFNMFKEGETALQKKLGAQAIDDLQKAWVTRLLHNPEKIGETLDAWKKAGDEDGLRLLLGDNADLKLEKLYSISQKAGRLEGSLFKEVLDEQGTNAELIFNVIKNSGKDKIGSSAQIDDLIQQGGEPFVQSVRAGIIENILDIASDINGDTLQKSLNITKLQKQIEELTKNENLLKFFDSKTIDALKKIDIYATTLASQTDVGGMIAAGATAAELAELKPSKTVKVGISLLKYNIIARMLSVPQTRKLLEEFSSAPTNAKVLDGLNLALNRFLREQNIDPDEVESQTVIETFKGDIDGNTVDRDVKVVPPNSSTQQVPVEVPTTAVPGSAVSSAQVVAPLPTMSQGAPMNVARAQQAFPFDPIFAAGGGSINKQGIMNTSRGRQMVV
jgi:hypothetical protein